eukprot:m.369886 g.369886  ORF g.369886 m.369886 type:complete len:286 (+) comp20856_c1_seq3:225-1082(+)
MNRFWRGVRNLSPESIHTDKGSTPDSVSTSSTQSNTPILQYESFDKLIADEQRQEEREIAATTIRPVSPGVFRIENGISHKSRKSSLQTPVLRHSHSRQGQEYSSSEDMSRQLTLRGFDGEIVTDWHGGDGEQLRAKVEQRATETAYTRSVKILWASVEDYDIVIGANGKPEYVTYQTRVGTSRGDYVVYRRFSEFKELHRLLMMHFPNIDFKFPSMFSIGNAYNARFLGKRQLELHRFLTLIAENPQISLYAIDFFFRKGFAVKRAPTPTALEAPLQDGAATTH